MSASTAVPSLLPPRAALALLFAIELAASRGVQVNARELRESLALPHRHAETLLQALREAGVFTSERGPRGGYRLARPAAEIKAGDVVRAALASGLAPKEIGGCGELQALAIASMEDRASAAFMAVLDAVSLADLQSGALPKPLSPAEIKRLWEAA